MGLEFTDVDFALAIAGDTADSSRTWTSLTADGKASFVGLPDSLTLAGTDFTVDVNLAAADGSLVDHEAAPLAVTTGPGSNLALTMDAADGELLAMNGTMEVSIGDFFDVSGDFALEKSSTTVTLADASSINVDLFTIGGAGVNAFAGINGGEPDAIGLDLTGVEFGLALMIDQSDPTAQYTSLYATADNVLFTSDTGIDLTTNNLVAEVNQFAGNASQVVDFSATSLEITTGSGSSVTLTINSDLGEIAKAESSNMNVTKTETELELELSNINLSQDFGPVTLDLSNASGALYTTANGTAMSLTGTMAISGAGAVSVSGTATYSTNSIAAGVNKTIGSTALNFAGADETALSGSNLVLNIADFVELTGDVTLVEDAGGSVLIDGSGLSAFIGVDGTGANLNGGTIGMILDTAADGSMGYALNGSGNVSLTGGASAPAGFAGAVTINANTLGVVVNETFNIAGTNRSLQFASAELVQQLDVGNLDLILGGFLANSLNSVGEEVLALRNDLVASVDDDGNIIEPGIMAETIPGTDVSLESLLDLTDLFGLGDYLQAYVQPITQVELDPDLEIDPPNYETKGGQPTLSGLIDYLTTNWLSTLDGLDGDVLSIGLTDNGFNIAFQNTFNSSAALQLDIGDPVRDFGLSLDPIDLNIDVASKVDFGISVDWDQGAFDFNLGAMDFSVSASADNLVLGAGFGPLVVSLGSASVSKDRASIDLLLSGRLGTDSSNNFTVDIFEDSVIFDLPVYTSLAGTDLSALTSQVPRLLIEGAPLSGQDFEFRTENFDELASFPELSVADMVLMFPTFLDTLDAIRDQAEFMQSIPFADASLQTVSDFSHAFKSSVYDQIDFNRPRIDLITGTASVDAGVRELVLSGALTADMAGKYLTFEGVGTLQITMVDLDTNTVSFAGSFDQDISDVTWVIHERLEQIQTLQEFVSAVNDSGVLPDGMSIAYDPVTQKFVVPVEFSETMDVSTDLDLGLDLGDALSLSTDANATISADVSGSLSIFFDLDGESQNGTDGATIKNSTTFSAASGSFTADMVSWTLDLGGESYTVTSVTDTLTLVLNRAVSATLANSAWTLSGGLVIGLEDVAFDADIDMDVANLTVNAQIGFMGATVGGVDSGSAIHAGVDATVSLEKENGSTCFSLAELASGDFLDALNLDFSGDAYARLKGLSVNPGFGSNIELPGSPEIAIYVQDIFAADSATGNDGATNAGGLVFTSAAAAFTSEMTGWTLNLGGERYKVASVTDANTLVLETTAGADLSGQSWTLNESVQVQVDHDPSGAFVLADYVTANPQTVSASDTLVVVPELGDAFNFSELSFADIISAVRMSIDFVQDSLEEQDFYTVDVPILNFSLADTLTFIDDFAVQLQEAESNPAGAIQEVESIFENALGIADENFALSFADDVLKIHIDYQKIFSDYISFNLNLEDMQKMAGGAIAGLDGLDMFSDKLGAGASANILLEAMFDFQIEAGIDITDIDNPEVFLFDYKAADDSGTYASLGFRVDGTDLEMGFDLGPLSLGVVGGTATIDGDGTSGGDDFATIMVKLDQLSLTNEQVQDMLGVDAATAQAMIDAMPADDGRFSAGEDIRMNISPEIAGGMSIVLPLRIDFQGFEYSLPDPIRISLKAGMDIGDLLSGLNGIEMPDVPIIDFQTPDILAKFDAIGGSFNLLAVLNNPTMIIDGIDFTLGSFQDVFLNAFTVDLPFVGDILADFSGFITDIRLGVLSDLRAELSVNGGVIQIIRDVYYDVFGSGRLNILQDSTGDSIIDINDVLVGWYDENGDYISDWSAGGDMPTVPELDAVQFDMLLGGTIGGTGVDIPLDIDLPGFELAIDGGFGLSMDWSYEFGTGISGTDGFYMATNANENDAEFEVDVNLYLDSTPDDLDTITRFNGVGTLAFFKATLSDKDDGLASGLYGTFEIDVKGDERTRVTMTQLGSKPLSKTFAADFSIDGDIAMDVVLELDGVSGLPKLVADLVIDWDYSIADGMSTPTINLENFGIDVGTLVDDFLLPIITNITDILEPVKPIVDALSQDVGLGVIGVNHMMDLIDTIMLLQGKPAVNWAFVDAVNSIFTMEQTIQGWAAGGIIYLGDIEGMGTDSGPRANADIGAINASFQADINSLQQDAQGSASAGVVQRGDLEFMDYVTDISNWMNLLTGGDATLFTYELPLLQAQASFSVPIFGLSLGPANFGIMATGALQATADFAFGYDTYGIRKSLETGNPIDAFDGFFISDFDLNTGADKPELAFNLAVGLEAEVNLGIIKGGLGGGISFFANFDLEDIERSTLTKDSNGYVTDVTWKSDGKIRVSEMITLVDYGGVDQLFNFTAGADVFAKAYVDVKIPIIGTKTVVDIDLKGGYPFHCP